MFDRTIKSEKNIIIKKLKKKLFLELIKKDNKTNTHINKQIYKTSINDYKREKTN